MKTFKTLVSKPSQDDSLWAIWNWNGAITSDELVFQLNEFSDKGFCGVAVRPSRDMNPSYLSEEFFLLFERLLSIAKESGIKIRLADDMSMPWSGFFQKEAEKNLAYRAQTLSLFETKNLGIKEHFEFTPVDDKSHYYVLVAKTDNGKILSDTVKNIPFPAKSTTASYKGQASESRIMIFKKDWYKDPLGFYVPNVFNPKVAQQYINDVLEVFTNRFSKMIPKVFEGFITELPAYIPADDTIPWDDDLIIKYKSRYKKNLLSMIPSLFFDVDDKYARNRSHVYNFVWQSIYERFPAFIESWTNKTKLSQWVLCPERTIDWSENILEDLMAIPPVELANVGLQNQEGTDANYHIVRAMADMNAVEFKRKTIAVIGRNRLCKSASLQSLKTEIEQHLLLGTSKIILDGCFFNIDQRSNIKTPTNLFWYHPDWDNMLKLNEYTARFATSVSNANREARVAVLIPNASIMADYLPSNNEQLRKGINNFKKVIEKLRAHNIEFDVISETFLQSCQISAEGNFGPSSDGVRQKPYQTLIVSYSRLVNNSTFVFFEKMASKNSNVLFINDAPQGNFDDGVSATFTARVTRLVRPKNKTVHVIAANDLISSIGESHKKIYVRSNGKICVDINSVVGSGQGHLSYTFHNNSLKRDYFVEIDIPVANHIYCLDCEKGDIYEIETNEPQDDIITLKLTFSPKQTILLIATSSKMSSVVDIKDDAQYPMNIHGTVPRKYRVVLKDKWNFKSDSLNAMPLASWSTRIGLSRDSGGFSHYYETFFEVDELPEICKLILPHMNVANDFFRVAGSGIEISVNGNIVKLLDGTKFENIKDETIARASFYGSGMDAFSIENFIMKGVNRVSIRTVGLIMAPEALLYPAVVAGNFSVAKGTKGWMICETTLEAVYGSWTKCGFPYLSGKGIYQQVFEVPQDYTRVFLRFSEVSGSVSVMINDVELGIANWHPMVFDITEVVEQRRNVINVSITNTPENILRMNSRVSGLIGEVYLDIY